MYIYTYPLQTFHMMIFLTKTKVAEKPNVKSFTNDARSRQVRKERKHLFFSRRYVGSKCTHLRKLWVFKPSKIAPLV